MKIILESPSWMLYISIVALLASSAFFSASETSVLSFNRLRMKKRAEDGDSRAKLALDFAENFDKTLGTILVGNNIVNIAATTISTVVCTALFASYGPVIATASTTVLILAFGEVLPKSYANSHSDEVALAFAKPLKAISYLLAPFTFLLNLRSLALRRRGEQTEKPPSITEEELLYFIESIEEEGVLEEDESNLVQSALEFDETSLREIITPRVNISAIDADDPREDILRALIEARHSRMPVYEDSIDNIIGVVFVREALGMLLRGEDFDLRDICEEPYFVHKGMKLSSMMDMFRYKKIRMAIVLDEYGGTLGIVTLMDLIEELVGDLYDEEEHESIRRLEDGSLEVTGGFDVWDMLEELEIDEDSVDGDYSTASGWAMSVLGHIPEVGEGFEREGYAFSVLEMDGNKISRLGVRTCENTGGSDKK